MKTLAIETSGSTLSIALAENGVVVSEVFWNAGHKHSDRLIPSIESLLAGNGWTYRDLEKIAVTTGPGSFTGIRVGMTCAKTLSQTLNIPLVGIDTLTVLEAALPESGLPVVAAMDALRDEVFIHDKKSGEIVIRPVADVLASVRKTKKRTLFAGTITLIAADKIRAALKNAAVIAPEHFAYPRAGILAVCAHNKAGERFDRVHPLYVRRSWAEERPQIKK